jgi:hypothetical protein
MDPVPPISSQPKPQAEAPRLPCPAHAPGYGEDGRAVASGRAPAKLAPEAQLETDQADRAFHAMLARLTGGISPVALSLAYIDGPRIWRRRRSGKWRYRRTPCGV